MEWNQGNPLVAQVKDWAGWRRAVMKEMDKMGRVRKIGQVKMTGLGSLQCFHPLIPKVISWPFVVGGPSTGQLPGWLSLWNVPHVSGWLPSCPDVDMSIAREYPG